MGNKAIPLRRKRGSGGSFIPLLFNLVVDVLTSMLAKAANAGMIGGLLTQFRRGGGYLSSSIC
jgi:hypothetical protein